MSAKRSGEGWNLFSEATQVVLARWDLTRTALAERWGGVKSQAKYNLMVDDLMMNLDEQWREGNDVHEDTLDVYLLECLDSYFNVDFEGGDDSVVTEVSLIIQDLYRKCAAGELAQARAVIASLEAMPSMRKGGGGGGGGGGGDGGGSGGGGGGGMDE